jgi:hypothetical protein
MSTRTFLFSFSALLATVCAPACVAHTSDPTLPSVTVAVKINNAVGSTTQRHVTSSPPGIDCTSDGTTTTGVCAFSFSGEVILSPNTSHGVVWSDDSLLVWTEDAVPDGGREPANWATINLVTGGPTRTFSVNYLHDEP